MPAPAKMPGMSDLNFEPKRYGRFSVDERLVQDLEPGVGAFLRECFVVAVKRDIMRGVVEYIAHHPGFEPCDSLAEAPRYACVVQKQPERTAYLGNGEWETQIRYSWKLDRVDVGSV